MSGVIGKVSWVDGVCFGTLVDGEGGVCIMMYLGVSLVVRNGEGWVSRELDLSYIVLHLVTLGLDIVCSVLTGVLIF